MTGGQTSEFWQANTDGLIAAWRAGRTTGDIAVELGVSRNAVAGQIYKLRRQGVELRRGWPKNAASKPVSKTRTAPSPSAQPEGTSPRPPSGTIHPDPQSLAAADGRPSIPSDPVAGAKCGRPTPAVGRGGQEPMLHCRDGSQAVTQSQIDAWLVAHGGPRRFEAGASTDILAIADVLRRHGLDVTYTQKMGGRYTVRGNGKTETFDRRSFLAFYDAIRVENGLTPICPPNRSIHDDRRASV